MANSNDSEVVSRSMLNEAVDAILEGVGKLVEEVRTDSRSQTESLRGDMEKRFNNLEATVTQMKIELKDEIDGLKADLSATVSRTELEELKGKLN
jgi:tRNA U34 5-carboxymethylaminomethyl modifying GTPase MnmE/TrmE